MQSRAAILAFIAVASCASTPDEEEAPRPDYVARGNEPGWRIDIIGGRLIYNGNDGETRIAAPVPAPQPTASGRRYVTDRLEMVIAEVGCVDTMSGQRFSDTVEVVVDGKALKGCGGSERTETSIDLDRSHWRFVSINGVAVDPTGRPAELRFADGSMSGSAGCNRFIGDYTLIGDVLNAPQLAGTRMGCFGAHERQEMDFLKLMQTEVLVTLDRNGRLILNNQRGSTAILERVPG